MTFRFPTAVAETNTEAIKYFTQNLTDTESGKAKFQEVLAYLGNAVDNFPEWHPIITNATPNSWSECSAPLLSELNTYSGIDHTRYFVRGFLTCPYSKESAENLVESVNEIKGLHAELLEYPLYSDHSFPVMVEAIDVNLEGDGTIRSRDALAWCVQTLAKNARQAQVAETWWNIRQELLGTPHGSRSSIFVNQNVGIHMRKILEALNNSGMYGPIKETSLDMLSEKKKKAISETLLKAAIDNYNGAAESKFEFELRDETCKAEIQDTWKDGHELSIRVSIGGNDLQTSGYYYPKNSFFETRDPRGKRKLAEKFI